MRAKSGAIIMLIEIDKFTSQSNRQTSKSFSFSKESTMVKNFLFSVIALVVCSTGVFAQDVFVTFGQGVNVGNTSATFNGAGSGTGFIFVRNGFDFDDFQLDLTSSNNAVAQITSATVLNSTFTFLPYSYRFNVGPGPIEVGAGVGPPNYSPNGNLPGIIDASGVATLEAISINQYGIVSYFADFDTGFDTDADAFLLATFDFDIVGNGTTTFVLQTTTNGAAYIGPTGFLTIPEAEILSPVFGDGASLTATGVAVPEPSSAVLLALGFISLAARRRR